MRVRSELLDSSSLLHQLSVGQLNSLCLHYVNTGQGSWSYLGTDATRVPKESFTMNLGFVDRPTVLHEFGHSLGLIHEHQSPFPGGFEWDRENVSGALILGLLSVFSIPFQSTLLLHTCTCMLTSSNRMWTPDLYFSEY